MVTLACLHVSAPHVHAQDKAAEPDYDGKRVRSLTFDGVSKVDQNELRLAIATEATRCKSILLKPFCWITGSPIFTARHHLNATELKRDELRLRVVYWRRGYRRAQVATEVTPNGSAIDVKFKVIEGPPLIARDVIVEQPREVVNARQLANAGMPGDGDVVDLVVLDSVRVRVNRLLWDRGFADAILADTLQLADTVNATWRITIDSRPRTTVGTVEVSGNEDITERTVRRLVDLHTGRLYRRADVLAAQRRLYRSELFRQALVIVPEQADSVKNVVVTVSEAPPNAVRVGAGFNTVEFVQAEANWTRYDWIGTARRLEVRGAISNLMAPQLYGQSIFGSSVPAGVADDVDDSFLKPTWRMSVTVTQPWLFSTKNSLGLSVFTHRRSIPGVVIDRGFGTSATVTREVIDRLPVSLTYRFEKTRIEAGDLYFCISFGVCELPTVSALRDSHTMSPLALTAFADRADDPLEPKTGFSGRLELEHASAMTASDFRYNRASAELARYLPMGRGVLAGRVRGGYIKALESTSDALSAGDTSATLLHPNRRFYAGGARSVRGFPENQMGPRVLTVDPGRLLSANDSTACTTGMIADGSCDPNVVKSHDFIPRPTGGNTVLEASIEYRWPLTPAITIATFVDAARVGVPEGALSDTHTAITPGFGVRYRSPIGPIRIDLGVRPTRPQDLTVITQVNENGTLRLVRLVTPKSYDPLEGEKGIRKLLARLQLHLAIGEAY